MIYLLDTKLMRIRFGLRTLLVFVSLVCVALWAIPAAIEWCKWRMVRAVVIDTMTAIAASPPGKPAVYSGVAWHRQYCLANVEVQWDPVTDSGNLISSIPRSDAVFVEVPGRVHTWARSADEVMQLLRQND
jgi:hypothetical protein